MGEKESLGERLNRLAAEKNLKQETEKQARLRQEQINQFIYRETRPEFERLVQAVEARALATNPALKDLPQFEFCKGGPYVKQGNVAAFLFFSQPIMNAGPISLRLTLGREPQGMYADVFSAPPRPIHNQFQPGMETSPDRIVWIGDSREISSDELADFTLLRLTEYFLERKRS